MASSPAPAASKPRSRGPTCSRSYYLRAIPAAAAKPRRRARSRHQRAADPGALLVRRARPHRRQPDRRAAPADARPVRPARPRRDGRRHRQRHLRAPRRRSRSRWRSSPRRGSTTRCIACATTPAPRPSTSRTSCCSPTTSSTSTSSCGSATRRWPSGRQQRLRSPSSSRATSIDAAARRAGAKPATTSAPRRRACRRCRPTT